MTEPTRCTHCNGDGVIAVRYPPPSRGFKLQECPYCIPEECEHKWTGAQTTGCPSEATDYVEFCEICGMENRED